MAALLGNLAVAACKGGAAMATGSSAMFSEAVHTLVDCGNQVLMLVGIKRAARPADASHPFGYNREIYFWSFVVAVALFFGGSLVALYEGWEKFWHPHAPEAVTLLGLSMPGYVLNLAILAIAAAIEGWAFSVAWKAFRERSDRRDVLSALKRSDDPSIFVVLFEDAAALAGIVVAAVGIVLSQVTGAYWIDGLASMGIGLLLLGASVFLGLESFSLLMGEASDPELVASIRRMAAAQPGVVHVNEVLAEHRGPGAVLVLISLDYRDNLPGGRIEHTTTKLEWAIKAEFPEVNRVFIECQSKADSEEAARWEAEPSADEDEAAAEAAQRAAELAAAERAPA